MNPNMSRLVLTTHITFSAGWLGAVVVFLALAITGITSQDTLLAHSAYLAMELSAWFVIIPFCLASLITGIVQALGTKWGLFKRYWIIVKLFLTLVSTVVLLLHMQPISHLGALASDLSSSKILQSNFRIQVIAEAGAAILVLLAATTISVYKPWGKTKFGQDEKIQKLNTQEKTVQTKKTLKFYMIFGLISLILIFILMHLLGGGMGRH
ncbi:MAG: hypothetical protein H0V01_01355 [Bacteroidetes bacterium]|nr:hypothetical protein [Bacteroidota bacterium]HET6243187.1 hypothetical protein [Bacteroidia bacterium]